MAKKKFKLTPGDIVVGGIGAFLLGKYFLFPSLTREQAIKILREAGHVTQDFENATISGWQTGYLVAWAKATRSKRPTFTFNKSLFNTLTGTRM
jgi:hypothetical protein